MPAPTRSLLDATQVLPAAFDDATGRLRTSAVIDASGSEIIISDVDDSIKIGNGSSVFATITTVSGKNGIDVNIVTTSLPVTQSGTWSTGRTWTLSSGTDTVVSNQGTANSVANSWPILITDGTLTNTLKTLGTQVVSADIGIVTNSVIHGLTTGGGGGYVDVKVNPSGALTVDATQSGTWNITNITGTVSLPTGAATSALQTTGNTSLSSIDGKLNSLGQKVSTGSVPVVIASDQSTLNISGSFTNAGLGTGLLSTTVSVTTSATPIPASAFASRKTFSVRVKGAGPVYFGHSGVTTANGYHKYQDEEFFLDLQPGVTLYGIVATGTCEVRVIEVS